jgi:transketolase
LAELDRETVRRASVETGVMGMSVRVAVAQMNPCPVEFVDIKDTYAESGTPEQLLKQCGRVARDLIAAARKVLARKRS